MNVSQTPTGRPLSLTYFLGEDLLTCLLRFLSRHPLGHLYPRSPQRPRDLKKSQLWGNLQIYESCHSVGLHGENSNSLYLTGVLCNQPRDISFKVLYPQIRYKTILTLKIILWLLKKEINRTIGQKCFSQEKSL